MFKKHPFGIISLSFENAFIPGFEIEPVRGYNMPHNTQTGKKYPNCCERHKNMRTALKKKYEEFPNCCENHKLLKEFDDFDKKEFKHIPKKVLQQVDYTIHLLRVKSKDKDWMKDFRNYVEYNLRSFGQQPTKFGPVFGISEYVHWLKNEIERCKTITVDEKKELLRYLTEDLRASDKPPIDIGTLLKNYKKWIDIFPFNNQYFKKLKATFEKNYPVVKKNGKLNPYLGEIKSAILTEKEQIDYLNNTTTTLLQSINAKKLIEEKAILNVSKHKIDLANDKLKAKNTILFENYDKGEMKFAEIIEKWLEYQTEYFSEIERTNFVNNKEKDKEVPLAEFIKSLEGKENLFCKSMPLSEVVEFFTPLITNNSTNKEPFLTEKSLKQFIKQAFLREGKIKELKLNIGSKEKYMIVTHFWKFYDLAVRELYENTAHCKKKYID